MKIRPGGSSSVFSLATRLLRADHAQAARELRDHRHECLTCEKARRNPLVMCPQGRSLLDSEEALHKQVTESADQDRQPHPDQSTLF